MKKFTTLKAVLITLGMIIAFLFLNNTNFSYNQESNFRNLESDNKPKLKRAGFWNLTYIYINDLDPSNDWSYTASTYDWCSGNGTWGAPYVIENVTIKGNWGQSGLDYIDIQSTKVPFIIRNCTIYNSQHGIKLCNVSHGKIINNNCSYNREIGISITNNEFTIENNNTISGNIVNNNSIGIYINAGYLNPSYNNTISHNICNNNTTDGIQCFGKYITIFNNTFNNNENGIKIGWGAQNNTVYDNNYVNNKLYGIYLSSFASNNTFRNNTIKNNKQGIRIYWGCINNTFLENTIQNNMDYGTLIDVGTVCTNNLFYNNSFQNPGGINAVDNGENNKWNKGTIGNYWHDFYSGQGGKDVNDDGIGDAPYNISGVAESQDNYPIWWDSPLLKINSPKPDEIFETSPSFNISIVEGIANTTWYSLDGGNTNITFTGLTGNFSQSVWNKKDEGPVFISFYVNDSRGYIKLTEVQVIKEYDIPQITIISPSTDHVFRFEAPKFNITIEDRSSINASWYTIDGGLTNYTLYELTGTINQTAWDKKGTETITLTFYANDTLGHIGFQDVVIWKDITKPIVSIYAPISNQMCGITAPLFNVAITDPNFHKKWYSLNGGPNITFTIETRIDQIEWDKYGNGPVLITFYANDTVGNENSTQVLVRKDIYSPQIVINSPKPDVLFKETAPAFVVEITDPNLHKMWYSIDGGLTITTFTENESISESLWGSVLDGIVNITFYANDTAGNINSNSVLVIKDTTNPTITILSPKSNELFSIGAPVFEVSITDPNLHKMWYSIDGGLTNTIFTENESINQDLWDAISDGIVNLTFYANDTAGNLTSESVSIIKELPTEEFPLTILIITIISSAGAVSVILFTIGILRKRKLTKEVI